MISTADIKPLELCLVEAVNLALAYAMAKDERVVLLGEDIGTNGGVFRATQGLQTRFGLSRVMDTPLAETTIAGAAVGMAVAGLRPIAEIQFMGFIFATLEHVMCHAARMRNRTRGRLSCPLVIRAPFGGGIHAPEHHSESIEALFAHVPGLRVVIPSSPARAYGLLLAAIASPDPVIFLEPKRLYRTDKVALADNGKALPLDTCFTLREGHDLTLISWGACIKECLSVVDELAADVSIELIDLATVKPIDFATIEASIKKTGRCVIVHEAAKTCGIGAEIAAHVAEHLLPYCKAPIKRLTGFDTVMPYFRNEQHYMISELDIAAAIKITMASSF
ncbi:MAG: 2-oxoisovalerate dehydrogenase E1 component beta subunit [Oleispira sp.]|jgi:2-oxoisovalerate dehydrogenase E1 component beta subunit